MLLCIELEFKLYLVTPTQQSTAANGVFVNVILDPMYTSVVVVHQRYILNGACISCEHETRRAYSRKKI